MRVIRILTTGALMMGLLWGGGCSKDVPLEGTPFYDGVGKRVALLVSSSKLKDGKVIVEPGSAVELKFQTPLTVTEDSRVFRLQMKNYPPELEVELFRKDSSVRVPCPSVLEEGGYLTVPLAPGVYQGLRFHLKKTSPPQELIVQEGRMGNFHSLLRMEKGKLMEVPSSFMPVEKRGNELICPFPHPNSPAPLQGVQMRVGYQGPLPLPVVRVTFFDSKERKRVVGIRARPRREEVYLYEEWLGIRPQRIQIEGLQESISLTLSLFQFSAEPSLKKGFRIFAPLPADLETVLTLPPQSWRDPDVEVFRWTLFPDVIIFNTKNYRVQKELFHRLAFFVEKKGYRGKLHPDQKIGELHGYNAHNYHPEGLASFFNEAARTRFPLNQREQWLAESLLTYGVLEWKDGAYAPGKGGILSISRESADYHRRVLLTHEAFHGIYYCSPPFRSFVSSLWKSIPVDEKRFWLYFLSWMQYDVADPYLVENEFQAYILQQPVTWVDKYFKEIVLQRIVEKNPEVEEPFKELFKKKPDMFTKPASLLADFLEKELGLTTATLTTLTTLRP